MRKRIAMMVAMSVLMAACGGGAPAGNPAATVENYIQARVKGDVNAMIAASCAAWEPNARLEAQSIEGRNAELVDMACTRAGDEGGNAIVSCAGTINTSYEGEARAFSLAERPFKLAPEGGEWRMCGYK
jgi:ABC-type glycerol-3-phosphate transport system substrate-binding protein